MHNELTEPGNPVTPLHFQVACLILAHSDRASRTNLRWATQTKFAELRFLPAAASNRLDDLDPTEIRVGPSKDSTSDTDFVSAEQHLEPVTLTTQPNQLLEESYRSRPQLVNSVKDKPSVMGRLIRRQECNKILQRVALDSSKEELLQGEILRDQITAKKLGQPLLPNHALRYSLCTQPRIGLTQSPQHEAVVAAAHEVTDTVHRRVQTLVDFWDSHHSPLQQSPAERKQCSVYHSLAHGITNCHLLAKA